MTVALFFQVNCVVLKGLNDDEICDFVEFTREMVCDNSHSGIVFYTSNTYIR
jgi:molybdenum cofactor biosynthesis enzyme MoaA